MDVRQLKYFITVATHENFSKAAQQLFISQPALSRRIHALEDELGVRLFERHLRGATLTSEGRRLLDRARYLLRSFDQLKSDIQDSQGRPSGPVIIGMTPNYVSVIGAQAALQIKRVFPDAQPHVVQAFTPDLHDMLRDNVVDIALLSGSTPAPLPAHMIAVEPLFEDRLCLVGLKLDPLLNCPEMPVRQLRGLPLILTGVSRAGIRNEIEALAARQRVPLRVSAEAGSFALAAQMIRLGLGYTIYVPSGVALESGLAAVPISGLWLQRSLAWPVSRPLSRIASEVLPIIRDLIMTQVERGQWKGARLMRRKRSSPA
ncbi:MAG: LysR family transcriptional regulator [Burkholderiales bacterium]|nr:LysR family transcriptional regulator [Burkholderiales bacterium]